MSTEDLPDGMWAILVEVKNGWAHDLVISREAAERLAAYHRNVGRTVKLACLPFQSIEDFDG